MVARAGGAVVREPGGTASGRLVCLVMAWLNYHHLLYFWTVARHGSITKACQELHLTQPAVSAQLKQLERSLGEQLFARRGRQLALTEVGRLVYRYAEEIFVLGRELQDTLAGKLVARPNHLMVGVADQVPKQIVYRLLEPTLRESPPTRLVVREGPLPVLLSDLSLHALDLVISDEPSGGATRVKAYNHSLGETDVTVFGAPELAKRYAKGFPKSLDGAPLLMPTSRSQLHRTLSAWFDSHHIRPTIVAEIEDSALLKMFGQGGAGLFAAPTAVEEDLIERYGVRSLGRLTAVKERFFAISVERRITHPVVRAIAARAQATLEGSD